jgi:uncharacterized SAM-binding protein YcdF (DUF218 family)
MMAMAKTESQPADKADIESSVVGWAARAFARLCAVIVIACAVAFVAGYIQFAVSVASIRQPPDLRADAIVVLTGGSDRIAAGLKLMTKQKARRLLISGVHPATTSEALSQRSRGHEELFACCVDLDRKAADTIGNAVETAKWVRANGYRSLIVVTSSYHMPRGQLELGRAMPRVELIPFPVVRPDLHLDLWYRHPGAARLLVSEFTKMILAKLRLARIPALPGYQPGPMVAK